VVRGDCTSVDIPPLDIPPRTYSTGTFLHPDNFSLLIQDILPAVKAKTGKRTLTNTSDLTDQRHGVLTLTIYRCEFYTR